MDIVVNKMYDWLSLCSATAYNVLVGKSEITYLGGKKGRNNDFLFLLQTQSGTQFLPLLAHYRCHTQNPLCFFRLVEVMFTQTLEAFCHQVRVILQNV